MAEGREDAELGGVADEDVEPAPAVQNPRGEFVALDEIAQVHRRESGAGAGTTCAPSRAKRPESSRGASCALSIIGLTEGSGRATNHGGKIPGRLDVGYRSGLKGA
jgi:hypothetical protein